MDFAGGGHNNVQMPSESEMMHQVKSELATAYAQEFYNTVRDKCFKACVTSPSSSLSSSERTCLERCVDRYVDATQVVSTSAIKALQGHQ
jgi:import inner membrane translocase subunit TIM13